MENAILLLREQWCVFMFVCVWGVCVKCVFPLLLSNAAPVITTKETGGVGGRGVEENHRTGLSTLREEETSCSHSSLSHPSTLLANQLSVAEAVAEVSK